MPCQIENGRKPQGITIYRSFHTWYLSFVYGHWLFNQRKIPQTADLGVILFRPLTVSKCADHVHTFILFERMTARQLQDGQKIQESLNRKLGVWVAWYAVRKMCIRHHIYARLHIFGSLTLDYWLMIATAIAYTGYIITEIFCVFGFQEFWNYLIYQGSYLNIDFCEVCFCIIFSCRLTILHVVFHEETYAWKWMNIFANFVILVTCITLNVFNLTRCSPIQSIWDISPSGILHGCFVDSELRRKIEAIIIFDTVSNIFTDILPIYISKIILTLVMVPLLPIIWKVQLPLIRSPIAPLIS